MKWASPTEERAKYVARHLRKEDATEVWLSNRIPGPEAVMTSWAGSEICRCIESDDGEPLALTGVYGDRIWLLGTDGLTATRERRLQLCCDGRDWVDYCLELVGRPIGNDVYASNRRSIRWLRHLGFEIESPRPVGPSGALFSRFWREA
jgi:hypothetical protein